MADQSGFGAVEAAKLAEDRYVIWNYIDITDVAPGIILTGLRVGIDASAFNVIQEFAAGNLMAGVRSLGLAEGNVGYLLTDGNRGLISDDILEKVEALKASIVAGEITVPVVPETGIQGTVIPPTTSEGDDADTPPNVEGTVIPPVVGAQLYRNVDFRFISVDFVCWRGFQPRHIKSRLGIGINRWFVVVKKPFNRVNCCWTRTEVGNPGFTEIYLFFTW